MGRVLFVQPEDGAFFGPLPSCPRAVVGEAIPQVAGTCLCHPDCDLAARGMEPGQIAMVLPVALSLDSAHVPGWKSCVGSQLSSGSPRDARGAGEGAVMSPVVVP